MENQPLFFEKQYFKQWWIGVLMLGLNGLLIYGAITQIFMGKTFGNKPAGDGVLAIISIATLAFTIFFYLQKMITKIDERGVYIKFRPYHKKWRLYEWDRIANCELKKYNPVFEFGGWGIRDGVYSMSGNQGLLLKFNSGKPKLMIGTNKPDEMKVVLEKLGKM